MAQWNISDYVRNPDLALVDAISDPGLKSFIAQTDLQVIAVDFGGGVQAQFQALSRGAIEKVLSQYMAKLKQAGADLQSWICHPSEFNLCDKLRNPVSTVTQELEKFLNKRWIKAGIDIVHLSALITGLVSIHVVAASIAIVCVLGNMDGFFRDLCNCQP